MNNSVKYYIVEASALPEIFLKVAEAKRLLATGEAATVNEATRMTDISRSAFYKYRDAVQPFRAKIVQARATSIFLECYATSVANLRGAELPTTHN